MPERVLPGPVPEGTPPIREAVCVHTRKVYGMCREKDCIEDLRLYPTRCSVPVIQRALSLKAGKAELLYAHADVEPIGFNRGYYTVDVRYYYRVTAEAFIGAPRPVEVAGMCIFDKRVILYGSEGSAKVFTSDVPFDASSLFRSDQGSMPIAVVEAVDPLVLSIKLVDSTAVPCAEEITELPPFVGVAFDSELAFDTAARTAYVTLGQFSILRLERDVQLLMPAYDYCVPERECNCGGEEDPCEIFRHVHFPVDEFFPPDGAAPEGCRANETE